MGIPKVIHQTWKNHDVPPEWRPLQQTWRDLHPAWEYRLWTDADNRALLAEHYAWFLPVYDAYPENIQRVDAARCFILHRSGGVYADLDLEALRPLDPLIEGQELLLACEPPAHAAEARVRERGFTEVIGNAFLASRRAHPFWERVFEQLVESRRLAGALDATGPFLITRAHRAYAAPEPVTVLAAELINPLTKWDCWGDAGELERLRAAALGTAFTLHHWSGSWWRDAAMLAVRERLRRGRDQA